MITNEARTIRLQEVVQYLIGAGMAYNKTDFYNKIGKNKSQMSETMTGRRPVTADLIRAIVRAFPIIDQSFFIEQNCPMLTTDQIPFPVEDNGAEVPVKKENKAHTSVSDTERLLKIIEKQQEQIDALLKLLSKND